jgi:hypothetical protein
MEYDKYLDRIPFAEEIEAERARDRRNMKILLVSLGTIIFIFAVTQIILYAYGA